MSRNELARWTGVTRRSHSLKEGGRRQVHLAVVLALIVSSLIWVQDSARAQNDAKKDSKPETKADNVANPKTETETDDRDADHKQLVALREEFTKALNDRDFEALKPLVVDELTFISISNEKVSGLDGLKTYWEGLFVGDNSVLKSISVDPKADSLTVFLSDSVGVTQGTSNDVFEFRKAGRRELTSRWTAVVVKADAKWKVARIHMSANVLDNPVIDAKAFMANVKIGIGAVVGLLLGAILFRRRKAN